VRPGFGFSARSGWGSYTCAANCRRSCGLWKSANLTFRDDAEKFEASVPNYTGVFGLSRSLDLFHSVGQAAITGRILSLTDRLCEGLVESGCRLLSPREPSEKSGAVTFVSPRLGSQHLHERLREAQIIVSLREGAIRVSPHFYNTEHEIDCLVAVVSGA